MNTIPPPFSGQSTPRPIQVKNQASGIKNSSFVIRYSSLSVPSSLLLLLASSCLIQAADVVTNNPFVPEGWKPPSERVVEAPKAPPIPVTLELRGIDEWNGTKSFYLYDKVKLTGSWVNLNDQAATTPVLSVDESSSSHTISVRINGKTEKLSLKKPDGKPLEIKGLAVAPPPAPVPQPGSIPAPNGVPAPNAPPGTPGAPGGGPGNFDRSQIPGYNAALPNTDPANIAAMRAFFDSRRGEKSSEKTAAPTTTTAAPAHSPPAPNKDDRNSRDRGRGR